MYIINIKNKFCIFLYIALLIFYFSIEAKASGCGESLPRFIEDANNGDVEKQTLVGMCYQDAKDLENAKLWYEKAVSKGEPWAQAMLGYMYLNGDGIKKDYRIAYDLFQKSSSQGNWRGKYHLAQMYEYGLLYEATVDNINKAISLYNEVLSNKELGENFKKQTNDALERRVPLMQFWVNFMDCFAKYRFYNTMYGAKNIDLDEMKRSFSKLNTSMLSSDAKQIYYNFLREFSDYIKKHNEATGLGGMAKSLILEPSHLLNLAKEWAPGVLGKSDMSKQFDAALEESINLMSQFAKERISENFLITVFKEKCEEYKNKR